MKKKLADMKQERDQLAQENRELRVKLGMPANGAESKAPSGEAKKGKKKNKKKR